MLGTYIIVAVCIAIVGLVVIPTVTCFIYRRNAAKSTQDVIPEQPPLRRLVIRQGRVVSANRSNRDSFQSASVPGRSWLMSTTSPQKGEDISLQVSSKPLYARDLDTLLLDNAEKGGPRIQAREQEEDHSEVLKYAPARRAQLHEAQRQSGLRTVYPYQGSGSLLTSPTSDDERSLRTPTRALRRSSPQHSELISFLIPPSRPLSQLPSGLDSSSVGTSRTSPKPCYLSPLQSRFHVPHSYNTQSPLSRLISDVDSIESFS